MTLGTGRRPTDQFDRIQHDMAVGQFATVLADQHDYLTPATPDDPIGGQPDFEAARAVAAQRFKNLEGERELIGRIPVLLSSVVTAVAVMLETSRQGAFERLGRNDCDLIPSKRHALKTPSPTDGDK